VTLIASPAGIVISRNSGGGGATGFAAETAASGDAVVDVVDVVAAVVVDDSAAGAPAFCARDSGAFGAADVVSAGFSPPPVAPGGTDEPFPEHAIAKLPAIARTKRRRIISPPAVVHIGSDAVYIFVD